MCSKFYNVNDNNSPTTKTIIKNSPTTINATNIANTSNINIKNHNNYQNTKECYKNLKEPEYDISFKFNARANSSSPHNQTSNNNNKQYYYVANSNYNCRSNNNNSPLSRDSLKSYDSCGGTSGSYESFHSSIGSSSHRCKLSKHNYDSDKTIVHHHQLIHSEPYFATSHATAIVAANINANSNAEDNNRRYAMILSRSCKPLKFSFASEWLV